MLRERVGKSERACDRVSLAGFLLFRTSRLQLLR
jgi:hypothetical protein